jgi:hypothetical protein
VTVAAAYQDEMVLDLGRGGHEVGRTVSRRGAEKTNLANFNNVGSGDREDWASTPTSTDIKGAYLYPGIQYSMSAVDITVLDAIGWGTKTTGGNSLGLGNLRSSIRLASSVPEPSTLVLMAVGALGLRLVRWRRQA